VVGFESKVEAYKKGKSVKEYLNEILKKVLPAEEDKNEID